MGMFYEMLDQLSNDALISKDIESLQSFDDLRKLILKYKDGYIERLKIKD